MTACALIHVGVLMVPVDLVLLVMVLTNIAATKPTSVVQPAIQMTIPWGIGSVMDRRMSIVLMQMLTGAVARHGMKEPKQSANLAMPNIMIN
jgi:hypothetical protein